MLEKSKDLYLKFIKNGDTICVEHTVKNSARPESGEIAKNIKVTITVPEGLKLLSLEEGSTVTQGLLDSETNEWKVGSLLPCDTATIVACFIIEDACAHPFIIEFDSESDACNCEIEGYPELIKGEGISCCDVMSCLLSDEVCTPNILGLPEYENETEALGSMGLVSGDLYYDKEFCTVKAYIKCCGGNCEDCEPTTPTPTPTPTPVPTPTPTP